MQLEHAVTMSMSPGRVLRGLRSEAQPLVLAELADILVAHQARALAEQCEAELPGAQQAVKSIKAELRKAERGVSSAKAELDKAEAEEQKARRAKGLGEKQLLAIGEATRQKARALDDAESVVRFHSHGLKRAAQKVHTLERLLDGLASYEVPQGDILPLLGAALGVNGG